MATLTKKRKAIVGKYDSSKSYSVAEASKIVKDITTTKFDASVDLAIRLGVDPRKANQMVRGTVTLPHGTGKTMRVLALVTPDKEAEAKNAGADFVKTSTGFSKGGATVHDISLMRRTVGSDLGVKASGGVKGIDDARAMFEAGATRIGASVGVKIAQEAEGMKTAPSTASY